LPEFESAIAASFGAWHHCHSYRCYAFFTVRRTSFIWTGIGTGCLEPLLCEIFSEPQISRIILIGTAGSISGKGALGAALPIQEARVACAGISPRDPIQFPNWKLAPGSPTQRIASTDYYYGFTLSKKSPARELWAADSRLSKSVATALRSADLVDMETGQFYHLCAVLRPDVRCLAIKGAANPLTDFAQQTLHSQSVLFEAAKKARMFLDHSK
jgi:hypothetical protein